MLTLRPSKAHRWFQCPGSVRLEAEAGDYENDAAEEGAAAHWLAAQMLAGATVPAGTTAPNGVLIDDAMIYHIRGYVEYLHNNFPQEAGWVWRIETPQKVTLIDGEGTPDFMAYNALIRASVLMVACVDLKYGFRPVRAEGDKQLACYFSEWDAAEYYGVIYQPRGPGDAADLWYYDTYFEGNWQQRNRAEIYVAAQNARDPNAPLITSPACTNCSGRLNCPALRDAGTIALDVAHENSPLTLTDTELAAELKFLRWASTRLSDRLEALEQEALSRLQQGSLLPGYYQGFGRGKKDWLIGIEEILALSEGFGVPLLKAPAPITPTQAVQAGIPKEVVERFTTKISGKPIICEGSISDLARKVFK